MEGVWRVYPCFVVYTTFMSSRSLIKKRPKFATKKKEKNRNRSSICKKLIVLPLAVFPILFELLVYQLACSESCF